MSASTPNTPRSRLLTRVRQGLAPAPIALRQRRVWIWFCLTLAYAAMLAVLTYRTITEAPYFIPDDARQHVFWMQRFMDPELFSDDWIADYFQSVAPVGFVWLYKAAAIAGIPPLTFNTVLPSILVILTAILAFLTCLELSALPAAGFAASVLLNQSIDYTSTVASGTPKAFVFGLVLGFLYGWLRRSRWICWLFMLLQGLFYPQTVLISAGVLALGVVDRQPGGRWRIRRDRSLWGLTLGGLAIAIAVVLHYALSSSEFGPTLTLAEAFTMSEFYPGGRNQFFRPSILGYVLYGRSGIQLYNALTPVTNLLAIALPILVIWPKRFPLAASIRPGIGVLWRILATSAVWFVVSHALLFKLHLPSRYTGRFLLLVFVLAAGIALIVLIDALLAAAIYWLGTSTGSKSPRSWLGAIATGGLALALFAILLLYPLTYGGYPTTSLERGREVDLYEFFAAQPKESLVASLSGEVSNLPSFSGRSVLLSPEIAIPYHVGYYREIEQRAKDLIAAQYSTDPAAVRQFIEQYGITHWLLDNGSFDRATIAQNRWIQQYQPEADQAVLSLSAQQTPVLLALGDRCQVFTSDQYWVLDAQCILSNARQ